MAGKKQDPESFDGYEPDQVEALADQVKALIGEVKGYRHTTESLAEQFSALLNSINSGSSAAGPSSGHVAGASLDPQQFFALMQDAEDRGERRTLTIFEQAQKMIASTQAIFNDGIKQGQAIRENSFNQAKEQIQELIDQAQDGDDEGLADALTPIVNGVVNLLTARAPAPAPAAIPAAVPPHLDPGFADFFKPKGNGAAAPQDQNNGSVNHADAFARNGNNFTPSNFGSDD